MYVHPYSSNNVSVGDEHHPTRGDSIFVPEALHYRTLPFTDVLWQFLRGSQLVCRPVGKTRTGTSLSSSSAATNLPFNPASSSRPKHIAISGFRVCGGSSLSRGGKSNRRQRGRGHTHTDPVQTWHNDKPAISRAGKMMHPPSSPPTSKVDVTGFDMAHTYPGPLFCARFEPCLLHNLEAQSTAVRRFLAISASIEFPVLEFGDGALCSTA
jgi:hypothetical protein